MIEQVQGEITQKLTNMIVNAQEESIRAFLDRVAYPTYQNHQQMRWASEGASEGTSWPALNAKYQAYKVRRYGGGVKYKWIGGRGYGQPWLPSGSWPSFPGGGTKMMIATGRLITSVTGIDIGAPQGMSDHRKVVDSHSLTVSTTVEYADRANQVRDFTDFGAAFYTDLGSQLHSYIMGDS